MEHLLIMNKNGSAFAGLLTYGDPEGNWIGIRPSSKSEMTVYFEKRSIHSILHEDGRQELLSPETPALPYREDSDIPEGKMLLVRVRGGFSCRGIPAEPIEPVLESAGGYWLQPSKSCGIVIHIPEAAAEEVFSG